MKIIGLTGQTGAGKSTVCKLLENHGFYHIDADKVARELTLKGSPAIPLLCEAFSENILADNGDVNRKELARRAFANEESTLLLNSITHPLITKNIRDIITQKENEGCYGVIIDAIALFESGENELCDFTVSVIAPLKIRVERIIRRDNLTEGEAMLRVNAQKPESFYCEKADYVIKNFPPYILEEQIQRIFDYE